MSTDRTTRARIHAALGDPVRLGIVEDLAGSDRSPTELGAAFSLPSNLLAHHLDVLEGAGLIERFVSTGDRRRRYIRLVREPLDALRPTIRSAPASVLFVCSHNSARSPLAAALYRSRTGNAAESAGTHPAAQVHPGAVAAARRAEVDLSGARPRLLGPADTADVIVTVCDRAHEELRPEPHWWHWSIPDPVETGTDDAFDAVVAGLETRIAALN